MKYIANILTDEPFNEGELYNVVRDKEELVPGIPTLIIGWERTKAEYPDASIIEWKVADNVYWTYGKYERRDKYEVNTKKFQDLSFKKFVESLEYVFYDVLLTPPERFESFLASLGSGNQKTIYVTGDMMYIYYNGTNKVVGLSLRDCDYLNEFSKKKIFSAVYNSNTVNLLKNNDEISKEIRYKAKGRAYILPYLYS
jgi:hypothetical protein